MQLNKENRHSFSWSTLFPPTDFSRPRLAGSDISVKPFQMKIIIKYDHKIENSNIYNWTKKTDTASLSDHQYFSLIEISRSWLQRQFRQTISNEVKHQVSSVFGAYKNNWKKTNICTFFWSPIFPSNNLKTLLLSIPSFFGGWTVDLLENFCQRRA